MSHFTPGAALAGGVLIGLAAVLLLWLDGRIAGVSGIAGGLWGASAQQSRWRLAFLAGLVISAGIWALLFEPAPAARASFGPAWLAVSGLLVGYGASLGGGCTSGHGVCGLARLSRRSALATVVFLTTAIATTFLYRHVLAIG